MSVAGILSSSLFAGQGSGLTGSTKGVSSFKQEFQQLGKDLKSGNISAAQTDYSNLRQSLHDGTHGTAVSPTAGTATSATASTDASTSTSANALLLQQMSQALQAGNISAAQQAYKSISMGGLSLAI